jgi:hypothetical protein
MTETMNLNQRTAAIWGPAAAILIGTLIGLSSARAVGSKPAASSKLATGSAPNELRPAVESAVQQSDSFGYTLGLPEQWADTGSLAVATNTHSLSHPSVVLSDAGILVHRSPFVHSDPRFAEPFPLVLNRAVRGYVSRFLDQPGSLKLAFQRSKPFLPEMVQVMRERGIPDDLIYLSFAESDFSYKHLGPWQFEFDTAKRFGLRVNKWIDERRDPILSTRAAAEYLAQLHDQADSHDWRVALIGWNMGEAYLDQYWLLAGDNFNRFADQLPHRTSQLLNRFMAVAYIAHNAASYGIGSINYKASPGYETRKFAGGTQLTAIAHRFGTSVAKLRLLNPALQTDQVPPSEKTYSIRVPLIQAAKAS